MSRVEPPMKLKTELEAVLSMATLSRYVQDAAGNNVKRMATIPRMVDECDAELALRVVDEFYSVTAGPRLSLTNGASKFEFFPQVLAGQARRHWDAAAAPFAATQSNADFNAAIEAFLSNYLENTAYADQKEYFVTATKAYAMTVKETASRVLQIVAYMKRMPGYPGGGADVYTDDELKMTLYRLMRPQWKTKFDASGIDITDANYTWDSLVRWFSAQERSERARDAMNGRAAGRGAGRGRGRGPGGRGRGSSQGRGYGRGSPYGRGNSSWSNQGRGNYFGNPDNRRGYYSGYNQGNRGQVRGYTGSNYGPPAQRQRTNDGWQYHNGGNRRAPNPARGRGGYALRSARGRGGSGRGGSYHVDHYHVDGQDQEGVQQAPSQDSYDDFPQEHQEMEEHPFQDEHYAVYDEEEQYYDQEYYGDY